MIEEHGPHLPVGADTLGVMYEADGVSRRVSRALPAWNVVMMPAINYGQGGANALGNMLGHPGTYAIRQSTLRSLVADLGGHIAQNGFKWMFVMNGHGGPPHNIAINEACDFVSETFGVTMLHLTGLFQADAVIQACGIRKVSSENSVRITQSAIPGCPMRPIRNMRPGRPGPTATGVFAAPQGCQVLPLWLPPQSCG
jgi:creatinine amidohydrolase/Fe(II)-dependent formamide hydrolase-like protein